MAEEGVGGPPSTVASGLDLKPVPDARFRRRQRKKAARARAMTAKLAPMPIPAAAPEERPLEPLLELASSVKVVVGASLMSVFVTPSEVTVTAVGN